MVGNRPVDRKCALMGVVQIGMAIWIATLVLAAISDMRAFRIPNIYPAILILLFVVMQGFAGFSGFPDQLWSQLFHFITALVVGMVLFAKGWIGGGDAKLYAAVALWFNFSGGVALLFMTSISGLVLAIMLIAARMAGLRKNVPKEDRRIPYGIAIAVGAVACASWVGWNTLFVGL
jgi:prepilin peptidase CpaA